VPLTETEVARYARQLVLPGFTPVTQECLRGARVHVVGAGPVAGPAMLYLALAGIGTILVDDLVDVAAGDGDSWLHTAEQVGQPRSLSAIEALKGLTSLSRARPFGTGSEPTAAIVCASAVGMAREAAERARQGGVPHVVAMADGDGGEVVAVPIGAPCYACGSRPGSGVPAHPGVAAALGALAALELLQILVGVTVGPGGRRVSLVVGRPESRATARLPACACAGGRGG
jgi:adenylyltransferase/sulfurtransferase